MRNIVQTLFHKATKRHACDMCGKRNKITLIYNDKFYCTECSKKVLKSIK